MAHVQIQAVKNHCFRGFPQPVFPLICLCDIAQTNLLSQKFLLKSTKYFYCAQFYFYHIIENTLYNLTSIGGMRSTGKIKKKEGSDQ